MSNNLMASCKVVTCFAHFNGKCMCLTSGRFPGECPFFKSQLEINTQRKATTERLKKLGIFDAMKSKYGGGYYELD